MHQLSGLWPFSADIRSPPCGRAQIISKKMFNSKKSHSELMMKESSAIVHKRLHATAMTILATMIIIVALAIGISVMANQSLGFLEAMQPYVNFMDRLFHTRRMASQSSFVEIGAIYYSIVIAILPCSLVYSIIFLYFPPRWSLGSKYRTGQRLMAIPAALLLIAFSVLVIYSMKGQDIRYFQLGSSFVQMLAFGWGVFAFCGFLVGFSAIVVWKAISGH